ncbi:hypothetical protein AB7C87_21120 [Natrarchaeobius sp. A-rgal3]|uniref:hypothetical protein n=1 Tax=Natrarchaeobius versutus TaxID=1679078 RepID=UPI003510B5E2
MSERSEHTTGDGADRTRRHREASRAGNVTSTDRCTRRQALAVAGTVPLALTAGCLDTIQSVGRTRVPVEPEEPDESADPEDEAYTPSPGEFYYHLENNGITVDELYHDTEDDDLILFYESDAETEAESDEEIGLIYVIFRDGYVARGGEVNYLATEVVDRFDEQVAGWSVHSDVAQQDLDGEASSIGVWNTILRSKVYEDRENPYLPTEGNESSEGDESDLADGEDRPDSTTDQEPATDE